MSALASDAAQLSKAVDDILGKLLEDPRQSHTVTTFIANHSAPYRSAFDFKTQTGYEEYVRSVELRTLSGDLVKSFEELEIANYLTERGVEFRYEARIRGDYRHARAQAVPARLLPSRVTTSTSSTSR